MSINKINCYEKTLEGLALYFANLNFKIDVDISHGGKFSRKEYDGGKYRYEHFLENYTLEFVPKFQTFYNDKECLIKVLIPETYMCLSGKYVDSVNVCLFKVLALNEGFVSVKISKENLQKMSLDFDAAYSKVIDKIKMYCNNELSNMNEGVMDIKNDWVVKFDYEGLSLNTKYSY